MSLLLPLPPLASLRRGVRRAAALAAVGTCLALPGLAQAQNGPLSLSAPSAPPSGPRSADPGMASAQKAATDKRYDDAIQGFDRVLAANPRNAQARFQRAWAMAQAGRDDDAIHAFSEMAQDFPELPEPHNNLALLYARRGDLKRAEAELLQAIDAKPGFAVAYTNLGDVYRRLAEEAYAEALRRNPADAHAKAVLGQLQEAKPDNTGKAVGKPAGKSTGKDAGGKPSAQPSAEPSTPPSEQPASAPAAR